MTLLVTVAHGTRHEAGNEVAAAVTAMAGARLGLPAVASYIELAEPLFSDILATGRPSVVVPLLLSAGYHIRRDIGAGRPLGPHPLLAMAQCARLVEAGARPGQPLVMVAAGSRDPLATRDLTLATTHLSQMWGAPARFATLAGIGPRPTDVVRIGDAVSPYLLATGHFAARARADSLAAGASVVADVIGPHRAVVDLVVSRAQAQLDTASVRPTASGHAAIISHASVPRVASELL
jgi:sirohydrochlorin ferrochelatase